MQYFTYPVNVSVSNIYESPSQFPAITICECKKNDFFVPENFTFRFN